MGLRNHTFLLALALGLPACADVELDPSPSPVLEAPELSAPREPHKTADTPPPIREHRLDTSPQSSQQMIYITGEVPIAQIHTATAATQGHVDTLDRPPPPANP